MAELSAAQQTLSEVSAECETLESSAEEVAAAAPTAEEKAREAREEVVSKELVQSKAAAELGMPRAPSVSPAELPKDFRSYAKQDRQATKDAKDQKRKTEETETTFGIPNKKIRKPNPKKSLICSELCLFHVF